MLYWWLHSSDSNFVRPYKSLMRKVVPAPNKISTMKAASVKHVVRKVVLDKLVTIKVAPDDSAVREVVHLSSEMIKVKYLSPQEVTVGCLSRKKTAAVDPSPGNAETGRLSTGKAEDTHLSPQKIVVGCMSREETDESA